MPPSVGTMDVSGEEKCTPSGLARSSSALWPLGLSPGQEKVSSGQHSREDSVCPLLGGWGGDKPIRPLVGGNSYGWTSQVLLVSYSNIIILKNLFFFHICLKLLQMLVFPFGLCFCLCHESIEKSSQIMLKLLPPQHECTIVLNLIHRSLFGCVLYVN